MSSAKWSTDIRVTVRTKKKRHVLYGIGSETAYCVTVDGHRYRCGYPVLLDATRVYDVYIDEKVAKSPLLFVETGVVLGEIDTRVRFVPETLRTDRVQRVESAEEIEGMGFDFVFLDAKEIEGYRKRREFNVCVKGVSNGPFDAVDGQYVARRSDGVCQSPGRCCHSVEQSARTHDLDQTATRSTRVPVGGGHHRTQHQHASWQTDRTV
jgi:hypothetical protein